MGATSLATMGGSVLGAFGAEAAGSATAQSLQAQASLQRQQAQEALQAGQFDAMKSQLNSSMKIGQSVAAYGGSGVTANSGSVLNVLGSSASSAELDRLNILHGADIKATNYNNQAALNDFGAQSAIAGSHWQMFGDLLSGIGLASANSYGASPNLGGGSTMPGMQDASSMGSFEGAAGGEGAMSAGEGSALSVGDAAAMA